MAADDTVNDAIRRILSDGGTPFQVEQRLTRYVLALIANTERAVRAENAAPSDSASVFMRHPEGCVCSACAAERDATCGFCGRPLADHTSPCVYVPQQWQPPDEHPLDTYHSLKPPTVEELREEAYGSAFLTNRADFDRAIDALIAAVEEQFNPTTHALNLAAKLRKVEQALESLLSYLVNCDDEPMKPGLSQRVNDARRAIQGKPR